MSDASQPPSGGLSRKVLVIVGSVVGVLVVIGAIAGVLIAVLGGNGPRGVARAYVMALADGDYAQVCLLSTEHAREAMLDPIQVLHAPDPTCTDYGVNRTAGYGFYVGEYGETRASILQHMSNQVTITSAKTHGDHAVVQFTSSSTYTGSNTKFIRETLHGSRTQKSAGTFDMVKQQGAWKVAAVHWDH